MVARYWVGGSGTWDATDTTHWAAASNGAGGQSVPTSADDVIFDASSGGGTVTVNGNFTLLSLGIGAHTGTIDWSVNNNNLTTTGTSNQFSGNVVRTIRLGSGTFQFNSISAFQGTGVTWVPGTALMKLTQQGSTVTSFALALLGSIFNLPNAQIGPDLNFALHTFTQTPVFGNLELVGVCKLRGTSITTTVTNLTSSGYSKGKGADLRGEGANMTWVLTNPGVVHWAALRYINCTGAALRAYNSLDAGLNTNCQISTPKHGRIIGG